MSIARTNDAGTAVVEIIRELGVLLAEVLPLEAKVRPPGCRTCQFVGRIPPAKLQGQMCRRNSRAMTFDGRPRLAAQRPLLASISRLSASVCGRCERPNDMVIRPG
jgi:hypothetical protein